MRLGILAVMFVFVAGCTRRGPEQAGAGDDAAAGVLQAGVPVEALCDAVLRGYRLESRRLSGPGLGCHYRLRSDSATIVVTIGVFASIDQARQAAALSHELMPDKPAIESGIGDQAWSWRSRSGSAVRFRKGPVVVRIAGDLAYDEVRSLAVATCAWIAARDIVTPTVIHLAGLPEALVAGEAVGFGIMGLPEEQPRPIIRAWASRGGVTVSADGTGRIVAPASGPVRVRCFAVWDDNRITVADQTFQVKQ